MEVMIETNYFNALEVKTTRETHSGTIAICFNAIKVETMAKGEHTMEVVIKTKCFNATDVEIAAEGEHNRSRNRNYLFQLNGEGNENGGGKAHNQSHDRNYLFQCNSCGTTIEGEQTVEVAIVC